MVFGVSGPLAGRDRAVLFGPGYTLTYLDLPDLPREFREDLLDFCDGSPENLALVFNASLAGVRVLHLPDDIKAHIFECVRKSRFARGPFDEAKDHAELSVGGKIAEQEQPPGEAQLGHQCVTHFVLLPIPRPILAEATDPDESPMSRAEGDEALAAQIERLWAAVERGE